jgi:eukaryotic-like serine/threonine-protein kinase
MQKHFLVSLLIFATLLSCKKNKPDTTPIPVDPPKSSEKKITSFIFKATDNSAALISDINGTIFTDTIIVNLNQGTPLNNLIPAITYIGKSLLPVSNVAQDFTTPVNYTVTAEDGTTKKYTVKILLLKANLTIYVGSDDGNLYAINANTGTLKWKYTTGGEIQSSPTVVNNIVYIGSNDKYLYAIDAITGTLKWKYLTSAVIFYQSPVVSNGVVFFSSPDYPSGSVYAIDAISGVLKWVKSGIPIPTSPTVYNGKVIIGEVGYSITAFDEQTGNTIWLNSAIGISRSNPAVYNGKLYIGGEGGIGCFNLTNGTDLWGAAGSAAYGSPTIDNETLYIGAGHELKALDANTGLLKWKYLSVGGYNNAGPFSSPVVLDSIVYAGNYDGIFYAINKLTGNLAWSYGTEIKAVGFASPTAANGVVYVGSYDKNLYAFEAKTGTIKWKFITGGAVYSGPCIIDSDGSIYHAGASGAKN